MAGVITITVPKYTSARASQFFKWSEFACKCVWEDCAHTTMTQRTIDALERTRIDYGKPIRVTSAFRCNRHNEIVGGVNNSNHKMGDAVDLFVSGSEELSRLTVSAKKYFKFVKIYDNFIHCDNRLNKEEGYERSNIR